jgi:putative transposase
MFKTNITDTQWRLVCNCFPHVKCTRPRLHSIRDILNAILYRVKTGCHWRYIPDCFPPWKTVYHYYRNWRILCIWDYLLYTVNCKVRKRKCESSTPTPGILIVDSQSVPDSDIPRKESKGYDGYKKVSGIKRFILNDVFGCIWKVFVTPANTAEVTGLEAIMRRCFESKKHPYTVKVVLGDKGFVSKELQHHIQTKYGISVITPLKYIPSTFWTPEDKQLWEYTSKQIRNIMRKRRYTVEQCNAHMNQNRILVRNYTRNPKNHETDVKCSAIMKMLNRMG